MAEVFPFAHNWREPYRARLGYTTDILPMEDETEQRVLLRIRPTRTDRFLVTAGGDDEAADAAWLDALLYSGQTTQWAVPRWPDKSILLEDVAAGADVELPLDPADRGFLVGGLAVLYQDARATALATITAVGVDSITVGELAADWPAQRTEVIPAVLSRWAEDLEIGRPRLDTGEITVAFDSEEEADPGVSIPETPAIFDVVDPNRREAMADTLRRSVERHASPTGSFTEYARGLSPVGGRKDVLVTLSSRAEIASLLTWFHGVRGALAPFWWPTWQTDLILAAPIAGATLTIVFTGYSARLFPFEARRHLAFIPLAGAIIHRRVLAAVDNEDGTETLTLNAAVVGDFSFVSFLLYVRGSDALELAWGSDETAEARLTLTELPREVPTSV